MSVHGAELGMEDPIWSQSTPEPYSNPNPGTNMPSDPATGPAGDGQTYTSAAANPSHKTLSQQERMSPPEQPPVPPTPPTLPAPPAPPNVPASVPGTPVPSVHQGGVSVGSHHYDKRPQNFTPGSGPGVYSQSVSHGR